MRFYPLEEAVNQSQPQSEPTTKPELTFVPAAQPAAPTQSNVARSSGADDLRAWAKAEAERLGVPWSIANNLIQAESNWNPAAIGPPIPGRTERAIGLGQLLPSTARELKVDPYNAKQNITGSLTYLKKNADRFGSYEKALAGYNWGPEYVAKKGFEAAPAGTKAYVSKIMAQENSQKPATATENVNKPLTFVPIESEPQEKPLTFVPLEQESQKPANTNLSVLRPGESVMAGIKGRGPQLSMVEPLVDRNSDFFKSVAAQINSLPTKERDVALGEMLKRNDSYGKVARVLQDQYKQLDKTPNKEVQRAFDPRFEARVNAERTALRGQTPAGQAELASVRATQGLDPGLAPAQFMSGVAGMKAGYNATLAKRAAENLQVLDKIDRGENVSDQQDTFGYQQMNPEQRAVAKAELQTYLPKNISRLIAAKQEQQALPRNPLTEQFVKTANDQGGAAAWEVFKKDPVGIMQQLSVESLPNSLPASVGGAAGLLMKGGLPALMTGLAAGTFPMEYMASIVESLQNAKVDISNPAAIEAKLRDPRFLDEAGKRAVTRGTVISASEALTSKATLPLRGMTARNVLPRAGVNALVETGMEGAGEAGAQIASGEKIQLGDVLAEMLGAGPQAVVGTGLKTYAARQEQPQATPAAPPVQQRVEPTIGAGSPPPDRTGRVEPTVGAGPLPPTPGERVEPTMGGTPAATRTAATTTVPVVPGMPTGDEVEELPVTPVTRTAPAAEPPVKPGFVRVYHSGSKGEGDSGRWASTSRRYASDYRPGLPLFYTDLPETDPRVNNPDYPEEQGVKQGFTFNFELTPQEAADLNEIPRAKSEARPASAETPKAEPKTKAPPVTGVTGATPASELPFTPTGKGPSFKGSVAPTTAAARLPDTPTVAPAKPVKEFEPAAKPQEFSGLPIAEVPIKDIYQSPDLPQFKAGANDKGVVEPLEGKFERTGVAPIQLWQRLDNKLYIMSGRHRLDLANRSGETTIPAQIHYESDGFTLDKATTLDAELNIRDGQGKTKDYVDYFKGSKITREEADARGLLARALGKRSYGIATQGSEELIAALRADQITDNDAFYIALNAPNDAKIQNVGMKAVLDGKSINMATNLMQAVRVMSSGGLRGGNLKLFGDDTEAMEEAAAMAEYAAKKQREVQNRLSAISGVAKRPELAKAEGINVNDLDAVKRREAELRQLKAKWDNWHSNSEAIAEIREAIGATPFELTSESEAERQAREDKEAAEKEEKERKVIADREVDLFGLTAPPSEEQAAPTGDLFTDEDARTAEYQVALGIYRKAGERLVQAMADYRDNKISKEEFLAEDKAYDKAAAEFYNNPISKLGLPSEPFAKLEKPAKKPRATKAEKPAAKPKEVEPANIRQARKEMEAAAKTPGKVLTPAELSRRRDLIAYDQKKQAEALEAAGDKVVNGKPVDPNLPAKNRLVLMPCCDTKGDAKAPAMELYKGVFFQTLKSNQKSGAEPNIVILSAKHGFIEPTKEIEPYDQVMTPEKAEEFLLTLQRDMDSIDWPDGIKDVLIVGGKQYQRVMRAAVARLQEDGVISKDASINVTSGGIGNQRSQLGKYLQAIPAEQPKAAEPEAKEETEFEKELEAAYKKNAEVHARDTGGEIVWRKGDNALIRAYDKRTGDPVYVVTFGGLRSRMDVEQYTGTGVSPSIKQEMIEVKKKAEQEAAEKHKTNPFIKFVDGVAVSESVSPEIEGIVREWKKLLKLDVPIYIATIEDARLHKNDYTGPHRRVGSGTLDANDLGSTRLMPDGSHYILFTKSTSPTFMLEILAHELGHVHQKTVYERASEADKKALKDAHQKWLDTHKTKTAQEVINSMRGRAIGQRRVKAAPTQKGEELPPYWRKFEEWYADQTARWAVSNKVPVTAVEKFFKRLGNQLRRFYQQLKARKYLPDETFAQYMDRVTAQPPVLTPAEDDTEYFMSTDTGAASSMSTNVGQAGWTERRIKRLINEFGYTDGRTYGIAAFVNPADFVRATTPGQKAVEYIREAAGPLDLKQLSEETQTPFLDIDMEKGAIIGHEGRHRMQAMADAGIARAAVVIWARDRYGSKQPAQYDPVDAMTVSGQRFEGGRGQSLSLRNLVPIEYRQEERLLDEFGGLSSTILYNISPTIIGAGLKSSRDEKIKQYATLRAALARVPKQVAEGKASIDMQRNTTELMQAVRDLQKEIKITKPRQDSAEQFLAKALKEYDAGNISKDVLDVINAAYQKYPELLEGLLLRVRSEPKRGMAVGGFDSWSRIVLLYKESSGVIDPRTIKHEISHTLEQMMLPEQRSVVIQAWGKAFARAIKKHPDDAHQKYFNAVFDFLDNPTEVNYRKAQSALPSYDMYQFINPSEFWAVNAESLMDAQLGTAWDKFKRGIRRAWEGIKKVLGFDNRSDIHKVFAQVMGGSRERITKQVLRDDVSSPDLKFRTLENVDEERDLMQRYSRPHTPMLDNSPVLTLLTSAYTNGKDFVTDAVTSPIQTAAAAERAVTDGLLNARNMSVWYGAGLESRDFARYQGQLRTSADIVTSSVALDNAIRSGNIGVEVIFRGGLEYNAGLGNYVAVERDKGMRGVYEAEAAIKKRLGNQLGTDIVQGYLEAKRSISIMDELRERTDALERAEQNLEAMEAMMAPPEDIAEAKKAVDDLKVDLEAINKAVSSVNMSEEEMYEFAALDEKHPELRTLMDNWTAVNQNLLRVWRQVGLISQGRYETLSAIKDYVPWYRIMNDDEDIHSAGQAVQSTTRSLVNIGREKLFKSGRPRNVVDIIATAGQQDFKIQPTSVVKVKVNGKKVSPSLVTATPQGDVRINMALEAGDLVTFETNREIQNIIDNMTRNVMRMTMNGIRQFASNRIVLEYAVRNAEGKIRVYPSVNPEEGKFNWMVNGKKVVVQIQDPVVVASIYGMENINLRMWAPMAAVANFTRRGVTLSGVFQVKQVFKDAPTAALVTGVRNPIALIGGVWKGFLTSLIQPGMKKAGVNVDPVIDILKAAGIGGFHSPARTPEAEIKRRLGIMNRNVYSAVIKTLDHIGDSSDMAQRVAVYKRVMAETGDQTQALYQAANVINFMHHGSAGFAQAAVKTVPFIGAWMNSTDVLLNSLQGGGLKGMSRKKAIARLAVAATTLSTLTLLYCMLAGGDPEYDELDDQTKLRNIMIPGTKIVMPINTSAALIFKAIPELIYNKITRDGTKNENDARRLRRALAEFARDALLGPEPIPAGVKTLLEVGINHSFFTGRQITPKSVEGVEAEQQYVASTSELGKKLSAMTAIPGTSKRALNPMEADHIIRGLFGTAGAMAQWVSNSIDASTRPAPTPREMPITGSFRRDEVPRGNEDLFYDLKGVVLETRETHNTLIRRGKFAEAREYLAKHKKTIGMYDYINDTEEALSDVNDLIKRFGEVEKTSKTPQERREMITKLQKIRNKALSPVKTLRRQAFSEAKQDLPESEQELTE